MSNEHIQYSQFYALIASYLLKKGLVNLLEFDERHLVVRESSTGMDFEFTLHANRLPKNGG